MPTITQITQQQRRPNRRNIFLDGVFAFGCNLNVIAKFRLREGLSVSPEEVQNIQLGEVRQECFDKAMSYLQTRLHSRSQLEQKLKRREYGQIVIDAVLSDLIRMNYVNDANFAKAKALSSAQRKHHGRRRASIELRRAGVSQSVADQAVTDVYATQDSTEMARQLAQRQSARLLKLDPVVAKRRLIGMLQRRGFEYVSIKPVIDEMFARGNSRG